MSKPSLAGRYIDTSTGTIVHVLPNVLAEDFYGLAYEVDGTMNYLGTCVPERDIVCLILNGTMERLYG